MSDFVPVDFTSRQHFTGHILQDNIYNYILFYSYEPQEEKVKHSIFANVAILGVINSSFTQPTLSEYGPCVV